MCGKKRVFHSHLQLHCIVIKFWWMWMWLVYVLLFKPLRLQEQGNKKTSPQAKMGEGEDKKEPVQAPVKTPDPVPATTKVPETVEKVEEKVVVPHPAPEDKPDNSKALVVAEKFDEPKKDEKKKHVDGSSHRDAALERVETEKRLSLVKAWEDNEKTKIENKSIKEVSTICSWENTKKSDLEAKLNKVEEDLEKKKAEYAEKMKNKIAMIHKEAAEKKTMVEAKRGEAVVKVDESAAKYRISGLEPKKSCFCFRG